MAEYVQMESTIRTFWVERQQTFFLSSAEGVLTTFDKTKGSLGSFLMVCKKLQGFIFCMKKQ